MENYCNIQAAAAVQTKLFASNTVKGEMLLVLLYITANGNNVESLQSLLRAKDTEGGK